MTGKELAEARLNAGYSIKGFARHLELNEHVVRRIERGLGINPAHAKKIADFFGVKVTDIMPLEATIREVA